MARPLVMRCGAFGDMVLVTALIQQLHARFGTPVDVITSDGWARPLLTPRQGVGEIYTLRSRRTPYWLDREQQALVRQLRARGAMTVALRLPARPGRARRTSPIPPRVPLHLEACER